MDVELRCEKSTIFGSNNAPISSLEMKLTYMKLLAMNSRTTLYICKSGSNSASVTLHPTRPHGNHLDYTVGRTTEPINENINPLW